MEWGQLAQPYILRHCTYILRLSGHSVVVNRTMYARSYECPRTLVTLLSFFIIYRSTLYCEKLRHGAPFRSTGHGHVDGAWLWSWTSVNRKSSSHLLCFRGQPKPTNLLFECVRGKSKVKVKKGIAFCRLTATGTHMPYGITHSVTCHPAEVTFPPLLQPKLVLDLATPEGSKAELT